MGSKKVVRPKKIVAVSVISLALNTLHHFIGTEYQPTYDSGEFGVNFKAQSVLACKDC